MLSEPGDALAGLLHQTLGAKNTIEQMLSKAPLSFWQDVVTSSGAVEYLAHLPELIERFRLRLAHLDLERAIETQHALGGEILVLSEAAQYAKLYQSLGLHAPTVLWVRGQLSALKEPSVAIVGTRKASRSAISITHQVVRELAQDFAVVSGGAIGIDTAAHRAALALETPTIAYMAGGLRNLYPAQNRDLFSQIAEGGILVSECAPEVAPTKWRFLQRNRLIAAHSKATIVIEAAERSGARNTAGHAFGCGREVYAFPGPQISENHRGCNLLIRDGVARAVTNPAELREQLHGKTSSRRIEPDSLETRVLDALNRYPRTLERICLESGLSAQEAKLTLRRLALYHLAFSTPRGWMSI